MNSFLGMDTDQGREVGQYIQQSGDRILEGFSNLNGVVNGVNWNGPDGDAYRDEWNSLISGMVNDLSGLFNDRGTNLIAQADAQDGASAGGGA